MSADKKDALGSRMKELYEFPETSRKFLPGLPVVARIDGRNFSKFTRGMDRPYDTRMTNAMIETTKSLIKETHAKIGYTQSDEISLVWQAERYDSSIFFEGKIMKMTSVLASLATAHFMKALRMFELEAYENRMPHFDCRVMQFPNRTEATNCILWRVKDCEKNAISMAAQSVCSHKELQGLNTKQMQELMWQKAGLNFANDFPSSFKNGIFLKKRRIERKLSSEIIAKSKSKQETAIRHEITTFSINFSKVINREELLFDGGETEILSTIKL